MTMIKTIFSVCSILLLLLVSFISFSGKIYYLLQPTFGVPWAYVLDQGSFLFIILFFFALLFIRKTKKSFHMNRFFKSHTAPIILLLLSAFIAHGFILEYYFFSEDINSILSPANNEDITFPFTTMNNGYPLMPFIFSFIVFKTNALGYNILSLLLFVFSVISIYWFAFLISRKKYIALLTGLLFATTPSYIDMFAWQASVQGMSLTLAIGVCSLIFLIYYQRYSSGLCLFLSILLFAASLKIGFVRIAGLMFPLAFLAIFPLHKNTLWRKILNITPFILLWAGFIYYRFGLKLLFAPLVFFGQGSSVSSQTSSYFPALSYYTVHLFFPTYIARQVIPFIKDIPRLTGIGYEMPSVIFAIGIFLISVLLLTGLRALFVKDVKTRWILIFSLLFIFSGLFYVPLFGTVPSLEWLDRNFISIIPPYGPGSRYVFFSAVGAAIFLSAVIHSLYISKRLFLKRAFYVISVFIIIGNIILSMSAHKSIVEKISRPDKAFIDKFFDLVPIDGKKKLAISLNPKNNAIEVNVGGKNWLYGFYKSNELTYLDTLGEARTLIATGEYDQNNVYGFYDNPETLSFQDVSHDVRRILFPAESDNTVSKEVPFEKKQSNTTFSTINTGWGPITILSRAILESKDLNTRILEDKKMKISMNIFPENMKIFPYSDLLIISNNKKLGAVWNIIQDNKPATFKEVSNIPPEFTISSFDYQSLADIPMVTKKEIVAILQNRERLGSNTVVTVASKRLEDKRVNESSLIDGLYTDNPKPANNQTFYVSDRLPATIVFELPYVITLGRISMNTSRSYAENYPTDLDVLVSYDGATYQKAGSINNKIEQSWSPNNGKPLTIPLTNMQAKFIKIVVNKTINNQAVMFDEIVIDDISAMKYTLEQIHEYKNNAFLYVDNQELLDQLVAIGAYSYLPVVYVCAEDVDWERQKNNYHKLLPGVWNVELIQVNSTNTQQNFSVPINCYGSSLRKVIIFGPPYPSQIKIEHAYIG